MGHRRIKDFFKRSNKRDATAQMAESDQRLSNLRRIEERIEDGTRIDESSRPENDAPSTSDGSGAHYNIAQTCTAHQLGDFISDFSDDPAMKVSEVQCI